MDLLEYQGKKLFADAGLPVVSGKVARTPAEALQAAEAMGGQAVVKAQVPAGGRGKSGGVVLVDSPEEAKEAAERIFAMTFKGHRPSALLIEERADIAAEHYLAIVLDRTEKAPTALFSAVGGVDIEEIAATRPEDLLREPVDPLVGMQSYQARGITFRAGLKEYSKEISAIMFAAYQLFVARDCLLLEINPLVRTKSGSFVALDAKITIDDNALYRHPDLAVYESELGATEAELAARKLGLHYVPLEGNIGIIGNGAGLVMATLDLVDAAGGRPANFLDVGGGARAGQIAGALRILLADHHVTAVLINIFGGITRCEEVAKGLAEVIAERGGSLPVPVVLRLEGNGAEEARGMLRDAPVSAVATLEEAAPMVARMALAADGGKADRR